MPRDDVLESCWANTLSGMRGADSCDSAPPVDRVDRVAVRADTNRQVPCSSLRFRPPALIRDRNMTSAIGALLSTSRDILRQHCINMGREL